ncbi:MAG: HPr(Ser) kinase/phosphatase [Candidatus Cloacimonetes bacterium]|nr:HPr(Ser) kinase/phosphatase [Candidatus Cloacimonadota bacterium]MCF7812900.1 HPr(Ser) kinase/phosphatase [Candidatus Cloacimonadota bacterium]MCF7867112.1 HPr(Ser) kinase/phosphatase [Candidatus Cloacimonadota bacterium]MCF7882568.1 HPr(Ser) kinase/phosphatase [Candidatus Cloacimonadota bacterium]
MKTKSIKDFFEEKRQDFSLSLITQEKTLNKDISSEFLNRPGLAFTGYFERFSYQRIQVLGEAEITYLQSLSDENLYNIIKEVFVYDIPCIIVTKGLSIPAQMEFLANEMNIPILNSRLTTDKLYNSLRNYLAEIFAPTKTIHGTLVDVYGVGILLTGKSGIGKSECALDLVERGQRLVTDDVVKITAINDMLIGSSTNDYGHFMEVRGVGLIDVAKMFGIQAARKNKRIDVQIELMPWKDNLDYERIGLSDNIVDILGTRIPIIYLPVSPGKNVSVIIEVVALNYILKRYGYDAAKEYTMRLQEDLKRKVKLRSEKSDKE